MPQSIYQRILRAFTTKSNRKAPCRARPRRLAMESLESRKLLTTTILTSGSISDRSFEAPALAANAYQTAPPSSPWQYSGNSGVSRNGSVYTNGDPNAPDGVQVGFLQNNASIRQIISLDAGVYNLSLFAAQRVNSKGLNEQIQVLLNNTPVGVIIPAGPVSTMRYVYNPYQTSNFTVGGGNYTLTLQGVNPSGVDSTAFIDSVTITPVVDSIADGGFEVPSLAVNTFQTAPSGSAWVFTGTAGISKNGSAFATNWRDVAQNAPAGTQVGFLQGYGKMNQTVFLDIGTYQISFLAAQRALSQSHYQQIQVLVDNQPAGTITPANTTYSVYQSSTFTIATAGVHSIGFAGLNPLGGDNTAFIDQVTLSLNGISGGSFETPALAVGQFKYAPSGSPWQFSAAAGIARNYSGFTSANPKAPDGTQVAFLQTNGSMSQTVNLIPGTYELSFLAAQRANQKQSQQIQVLFNGVQVALITPVSTSYNYYVTSDFTFTAQTNTVTIRGMNPQGGDNTALIDAVTLAPVNDQISDGSFEAPSLAPNSYQTAPAGSPWTFSGNAGLSRNGSAYTSGNPIAPSGLQVAFLQGTGSSISESVYLDPGTYDLSFLAAQRAYSKTQTQQIQVLFNSTPVALVSPVNTSYTLCETSTFTVQTPGVYPITFVGTNPQGGDNTALIDNVALATADNQVFDGSFEAPALAAYSYAAAPGGSAWQFSAGSAGLSTNGSGLTSSNSNSPSGNQVAYIQGNGTISQSINLDAGAYYISFMAAQRIKGQTVNQQIEVLIDGGQVNAQNVGVITPSASSTFYTPYQTLNFTINTPGTHTVAFVGLNPQGANSVAFIDAVTIYAGCAVTNGSFETPYLAVGQYQYAPSGASWQFSANAGVTRNYSTFVAGNPNAPSGVQVAFLQGTNASMSQSVYFADGYYDISFLAAQRGNNQSHYQTIQVLLDGNVVGTATPFGTKYGSYATSQFHASAGMHIITFVALNPLGGDNTALIDNVQLSV